MIYSSMVSRGVWVWTPFILKQFATNRFLVRCPFSLLLLQCICIFMAQKVYHIVSIFAVAAASHSTHPRGGNWRTSGAQTAFCGASIHRAHQKSWKRKKKKNKQTHEQRYERDVSACPLLLPTLLRCKRCRWFIINIIYYLLLLLLFLSFRLRLAHSFRTMIFVVGILRYIFQQNTQIIIMWREKTKKKSEMKCESRRWTSE